MNILLTCTLFKTGGAEKLTIDILNNMELNKEDKIFLCIINNVFDKRLIDSINPKVEIKLLKRKVGGEKLKYLLEYIKFVRKNKIDVIHCQCIDSLKFSIPCKILNPKIRIFRTVHDTLYVNLPKYEVLFDKLFTSKLIAISKSVEMVIRSRGIKNKVVLLYNSIDINKFNNLTKKLSRGSLVLGNVARLFPEQKGQDVLIKALKIVKTKYPDIMCYFAGDYPDGKSESLEKLKLLADQEDVKANVEFLGNVVDVPAFLSKLDIFVLPSRVEGFGLALIEAMAANIPVIASDIDGPNEIIGNNEFGVLFKSEDYVDLADKIFYVIDNIDKIDTKKASSFVRNEFDIRIMTNKLYELYKSKS